MVRGVEIIRETTDVLVVAFGHVERMDVELRLTSLDPPEGNARLGDDAEARAFVGWLGLLHLLWELFGTDHPAPPPRGDGNIQAPSTEADVRHRVRPPP
jgi:hypothetical protein